MDNDWTKLTKPKVALFGEPNELVMMVVDDLIKMDCVVVLLSNNYEDKNDSERAIYFRNYKSFFVEENAYLIKSFDYVLLFNLENKDVADNISKVFMVARASGAKTTFINTYVAKNWNRLIRSQKNNKLYPSILFVGEVACNKTLLSKNLPIGRCVEDMSHERQGSLIKGVEYYFLSDATDVSGIIIQNIFSLKPYGKNTAIFSQPVRVGDIVNKLSNKFPDINLSFRESFDNVKYPETDEKIYLNKTSENILTEVLGNTKFEVKTKKTRRTRLFNKNTLKKRLSKKASTKQKLQISRKTIIRLTTKAFGIIASMLSIPFLIVGLSLLFLLVYKQLLLAGYLNRVGPFVSLSKNFSALAYGSSSYLEDLPVIGQTYGGVKESSLLMIKTANVTNKIVSTTYSLSELLESVTGQEEYDLEYLSNELYLDLDLLSRELGFLESELNNTNSIFGGLVEKYIITYDLLDIRKNIIEIKNITERLPVVLGGDNEKTYALVLQNNNIINSSGGEIVAFAVVTFHKGRIVKKEMFDESYVKQRVEGIVETPLPIKKYMDDGLWRLKDAGWDPDFSVTAQKIEWFVDKSADIGLDGIVAINLNYVEEFLVVNNDSKEQEQKRETIVDNVEDNQLSKVLLEMIKSKQTSHDIRKTQKMTNLIIKNLFSKDIRVFVHDNEAQKSIDNLGWSGNMVVEGCVDNCFNDFVHVSEVNMTGEVINNIGREAQLNLSFEEGIIKKRLVYYIENKTKQENGKKYDAFVRLIANGDVGFEPVIKITDNKEENLEFIKDGYRGFKEMGVFVSVSSGEALAVIFRWQGADKLDYKSKGEYTINWRKQVGMPEYPVEIELAFHDIEERNVEGKFVLTEDGKSLYNTSLSRDLVSRIFW